MAEGLAVGEVAARSGVSVSALHFYERKGLIRQLTHSAATSGATAATCCGAWP